LSLFCFVFGGFVGSSLAQRLREEEDQPLRRVF